MTGEGRVPAGDFRAIVDVAAAQGRFEPIDRASGGLVDWPGGNAPYAYGAYFHQYSRTPTAPKRWTKPRGRDGRTRAAVRQRRVQARLRPLGGRSVGRLPRRAARGGRDAERDRRACPPTHPSRLHGIGAARGRERRRSTTALADADGFPR